MARERGSRDRDFILHVREKHEIDGLEHGMRHAECGIMHPVLHVSTPMAYSGRYRARGGGGKTWRPIGIDVYTYERLKVVEALE
jgi:hypothetical protein